MVFPIYQRIFRAFTNLLRKYGNFSPYGKLFSDYEVILVEETKF